MSEIITRETIDQWNFERTYTAPGNPKTARALEIAFDLQVRLDERCQSMIPSANVEVSAHVLQLRIGEIDLWGSEENDGEELTVDWCWNKYREEILCLMEPFDEKT